MAKWKETTKTAKTSTEYTAPWRVTIELDSAGSIKNMEAHCITLRKFEDGASTSSRPHVVLVEASSLTGADLTHLQNVDAAIQKLIGDRLPA